MGNIDVEKLRIDYINANHLVLLYDVLHVSYCWSKAIHASLWLVALKNYANIRNNIPTEYILGPKIGHKQSPHQFIGLPLPKFLGIESSPNMNHFHPFSSPVYVLSNTLQASQSHNKWIDRSKVGILLFHSPSHTSSVPLILKTTTACVSPQFHCHYDNEFSTCKTDSKFKIILAVQGQAKRYKLIFY